MTAAAPIERGDFRSAPDSTATRFYGAFTTNLDFAHRAAMRRARKLSSIDAGGVRRTRSASVKLLILLLAAALAGYLLSAVWKPERY